VYRIAKNVKSDINSLYITTQGAIVAGEFSEKTASHTTTLDTVARESLHSLGEESGPPRQFSHLATSRFNLNFNLRGRGCKWGNFTVLCLLGQVSHRCSRKFFLLREPNFGQSVPKGPSFDQH